MKKYPCLESQELLGVQFFKKNSLWVWLSFKDKYCAWLLLGCKPLPFHHLQTPHPTSLQGSPEDKVCNLMWMQELPCRGKWCKVKVDKYTFRGLCIPLAHAAPAAHPCQASWYSSHIAQLGEREENTPLSQYSLKMLLINLILNLY